MHEDQLRRELEILAQRLERVERWLGMESFFAGIDKLTEEAAPPTAPIQQPIAEHKPQPPAPPIAPPVAVARQAHDESVVKEIAPEPPHPIVAPPVQPREAPSTLDQLNVRVAEVRERIDQYVTHPPTSPPISAPPRVPTYAKGEPERPSLEFLIGGKWMAWVGALVVVVAAGFLVQIGIKSGFWGRLAPEFRCLLIAGFGGALIAGGEIALRRLGRAASVGLFGAGLGVMYLDAFATFRFFKIVSPEWAFVLMAVVAVMGFAITLRTKFLTIGVLSILGGYLTPILLRGAATHDLELLMFLTMLLGIALALAAKLPRDFHALRYVALGGQIAIGFGWLVTNASEWRLGIVFMSAWWTMVVGEAVFAAMRRIAPIGNPLMVVIATACYVTGGCWILNQAPGTVSDWLGIFTGMVAVLCAAVAFQFGSGLEVLRQAPAQAIDKLAMTLWAQSGVLLAAAVALQFDGFAESIGWLAVGLAAIECGRRLPSRGVSTFGMIVLSLAVARVMLFDWWPTTMRTALAVVGDVAISRWALLALATLLVLHVAAHRLRTKAPAAWPILLACAGTLIWMVACRVAGHGLVVTAGWLAGCVVLLALEKLGRRQRYFEIAATLLVFTAARWLIVDALLPRATRFWDPTASLPVLNWQMALAAMIAAVGWWTYRLLRTREALRDAANTVIRAAWQWVLVLGVIFGLLALSFEVDRAVERLATIHSPVWWSVRHVRQLLLTLLWAMGGAGVGMMAVVMRRGDSVGGLEFPRVLAGLAWVVLISCAAKWIVGDTAFWAISGRRAQFIGSLPVANVQMLVGAVLATAMIVLRACGVSVLPRSSTLPMDREQDLVQWVPVGAALMLLWGLSFEVDRAISRIQTLPAWMSAWDSAQLRGLFITGLWAIGGAVLLHLGRWRISRAMIDAGWGIAALAACVWLTFLTLAYRFAGEPADTATIFNLQFIIGAIVAGVTLHLSATMLRLSRTESPARADSFRHAAKVGFGLVTAIVLLLGSLEIDRFFADDPMSRQTGFSVWWAIFGVLLVLLGFYKLSAAARYAGLGILSITLAKVLLVDFSALDDFPRVISTAAAGLLFIATSLVYTKLSPRILQLREKSRSIETGAE